MARPRLTTSKKTSFGKRSDAEKSFKDKKKDKGDRLDSDRPRGSYGKTSRFGSKPSFRKSDSSSDSRPTRASKPFGKREEGDRPFRKSTRPFDSSSEKPKRFSSSRGGDRFEKKPFRSEGGSRPFRSEGGGRPFNKGPRSFDADKRSGFSKREGDREERPFRKSSSSFGDKGFDKKPFRGGDEKPFRKGPRSFDSNEGSGTERPFRKSGPRSFNSDRPKPFGKESYSKRDGDAKPFRKSNPSFDSRGDSRPKKFSKDDVTKKGERKSFVQSRIENSKVETRPEYKEKPKSDSELIRLNKFMANSGVGSRREADELIKMGLVSVNGATVTEMGHKVKITDDVRYEGKKLKAEKPVYILLNKPKGFITTTDDPQERNTVMGIVANACKERVYPVGRLDRNTTGLLLLTNDGDLADKLTHPSYNVKKIYKVELDKPITKNDLQKIAEGVHLEEGKAVVDDIAVVSDDKKTVGVELHIGWNRIVRRIFESQGYEVVKLDRVAYAGLDKKDLNRGQWRFLKPEEVVTLKHFK